jgi:hypothetical protein
MASVLLVERVTVLRILRRLGQAAPAAGDRRGHRAVAALGSSVVGARGPVPCLAATDVPHLEKNPRPNVHEGTPSLHTSVEAHAGHVTARHAFTPQVSRRKLKKVPVT